MPKLAMPVVLSLALIILLAAGIGLASLPWGSWFKSPPKAHRVCVYVPDSANGQECYTVTVPTITHS